MQGCQVCGRSFDPMGFQVIIPELGRGFDRIECAQTARRLATPGSRIAAPPLAAVVAPIGAAAAAPALGLTPLSTPAAMLGFLAAGTAAAVFLWVRVLGTDTASFPLVLTAAPPAVAGKTVEANPNVEVASSAGDGVAPSPRADTPRPVVAGSSIGSVTGSAPVVARQPAGPSRNRQNSPPKDGGKTKHKSNHGHHGKGHLKHGDSGTNHQPGHGHSPGGQSAHSSGGSSPHGRGSGKGGGHGKKH